jgi:tetratricopeptide (TPR) repeat protein
MKDAEKAMALLDRAIKAAPGRAESWVEKGLLLTEMKKYKEAMKCFEKAEQLKADFYLFYYGKTCLSAKMNQPEKALSLLKEMIKKYPEKKNDLRLEKDFKSLYEEWEFWEVMNH